MITHQDRLLQKVLNGTATKVEVKEFEKLLASNDTTLMSRIVQAAEAEWIKRESPQYDPAMPAELKSRIQEIRHNLMEGVKPASRSRQLQWRWTAAAACIVTIIGIWFFTMRDVDQLNVMESSPDVVLAQRYEGRQAVTLPDGSTAILNEGSELYFDNDFGKGKRIVTLSGEAFFDVQHDPNTPFIVQTGIVMTKVLGTAFNILSGGDDVIITVTRGKVQVSDDVKVYDVLLPDEQLAVNTATHDFEKSKVNSEAALEWKSKFLILDNVTMEEAARMIGERFDVAVQIENDSILNCNLITSFFEDEDLNTVLDLVTRVTRATYVIEGDKVMIIGGQCL